MCGIFCLLNNNNTFTENFILQEFLKGRNRGPEHTKITPLDNECVFGFHRLAINGLNSNSNQPIIINNVSLICNGEIYNYKELYKLMDIIPTTDSDCEVIIHLYIKYGIEQTLQMLDGVFGFVLCDNNLNKLYVSRDPYGVRPLYRLESKLICMSMFASELKVLSGFYNEIDYRKFSMENFQPGTFSEYKLFSVSNQTFWQLSRENIIYHFNGFNSIMFQNDENTILKNIQYYLTNAVKKRVLTTERPIACLLSGGLDSSLITALVALELKNKSVNTKLNTFSIGFSGSEDLRNAKIVSDYIGTKHTEIIIDEETFFNTIPKVIKAIESYDTTTIRASVGNYLLGEYISKNIDAKVIFNGDGSDELCGGYLYMNLAGDAIEFDKETRRLLKDIHLFDVLRSDKCISSHGLEPRTPFLDRSFVNYYLSIHPYMRFHTQRNEIEKYLLRRAFADDTFGKKLLPYEILWRKKEAFSDGMNKKKSLSSIIEDNIKNLPNFEEIDKIDSDTLEKKYYKYLFDLFYPNCSHIIPYFWMPKYTKATDPSAKTLDIYKK
jgi:asparagine synthase (glutamine-hydrolysing)